jgi:hypothetical protein
MVMGALCPACCLGPPRPRAPPALVALMAQGPAPALLLLAASAAGVGPAAGRAEFCVQLVTS